MCISYFSVVVIKHYGHGKLQKVVYLNFFNVHNGKDSVKSLSRQKACRLEQVAESSYLEVQSENRPQRSERRMLTFKAYF